MYVNNCGVIVLVQHLTVFCKYQNIFPPSPLQPRDGSWKSPLKHQILFGLPVISRKQLRRRYLSIATSMRPPKMHRCVHRTQQEINPNFKKPYPFPGLSQILASVARICCYLCSQISGRRNHGLWRSHCQLLIKKGPYSHLHSSFFLHNSFLIELVWSSLLFSFLWWVVPRNPELNVMPAYCRHWNE